MTKNRWIVFFTVAGLLVAGLLYFSQNPNAKESPEEISDKTAEGLKKFGKLKRANLNRPLVPFTGEVFSLPGTFTGFMQGAGLVMSTVLTAKQAQNLGSCPVGTLAGGYIAGRDKEDHGIHLKCNLNEEGWFTVAWKQGNKWVVSHDAKSSTKPEITFHHNCACGHIDDGVKVCGLFAYSVHNGFTSKELREEFGETYVTEGKCPSFKPQTKGGSDL